MINTILNLLRSDGYITLNKTLVRNIGLLPATIFSEFSSKYKYFHDKGQLKDGFFYCTIPDIEKELGLSRKEQDTAINKLIALGLIEKKVMKLKGDESPKRYIQITNDINLLLKCLEDIDNSEFVQKGQIENKETDISICPKGTTNKNNIIILSNENNQSVSPEENKTQSKQNDDITIENVKEKIGYTALKQQFDNDIVDEITLNILDMYYSNYIYIQGDKKPKEIILNVLGKLNHWHIVHVLDKYLDQTTKVKNTKDYLRTMIYNAVLEMGANYNNQSKRNE